MIQRADINRTFMISAAAIALILFIIVAQLPKAAEGFVMRGIGPGANQQAVNDLLSEHEQTLALYRDRFDGRSVFYTPPAPRREPVYVPPPPTPVARPEPQGDRPAPPSYAGPSIQAIVGETVFFVNGGRLRVGESATIEGHQVKILSTDEAPRFARVEHQRTGYLVGNYEVPIFSFSFTELLAEDDGRPSIHRDPPGMTEVKPAPPAAEVAAAADRTVARADSDRAEAEEDGIEIETPDDPTPAGRDPSGRPRPIDPRDAG